MQEKRCTHSSRASPTTQHEHARTHIQATGAEGPREQRWIHLIRFSYFYCLHAFYCRLYCARGICATFYIYSTSSSLLSSSHRNTVFFFPFRSPFFSVRFRYIFVWFLFHSFFLFCVSLDRINSRYGISFARFIPLT